MKKLHDQLLRNIYQEVNGDNTIKTSDYILEPYTLRNKINKELLASSALPAHYYITGFKNFKHLYEVAYNEQNTRMRDTMHLIRELRTILCKRTFKQHNMPAEMYVYLRDKLYVVNSTLYNNRYADALLLLRQMQEHIDSNYGFKKQRELLDAYEKEHPVLNDYWRRLQFKEKVAPEVMKEVLDYYAYQKTVRFSAAWNYSSVLTQFIRQFEYNPQYV